MGPVDFGFHAISFLAPAFFVALVVTFGARWLGAAPRPLRWWVQVAINFTAGAAVLAAGLWYFGVDGKMATYAGVVTVVALSQWVCGRGWKA
jgi:hypothetical protein